MTIAKISSMSVRIRGSEQETGSEIGFSKSLVWYTSTSPMVVESGGGDDRE